MDFSSPFHLAGSNLHVISTWWICQVPFRARTSAESHSIERPRHSHFLFFSESHDLIHSPRITIAADLAVANGKTMPIVYWMRAIKIMPSVKFRIDGITSRTSRFDMPARVSQKGGKAFEVPKKSLYSKYLSIEPVSLRRS